MPYAPQWLLQQFLDEVNQGRHCVLPVCDSYSIASCHRCYHCHHGPSSMCLLVDGQLHYYKPSICPDGRGLVWQPRHYALSCPCITPLPSAFTERFIRQRVLQPKLSLDVVDLVMSFLEDVHTVSMSLKSSNENEDGCLFDYGDTTIDNTKRVCVFNVDRPLLGSTFRCNETANDYFAKFGIQGLIEDEISETLDEALDSYNSSFVTFQEPNLVEGSSDDEDF